MVYDEITALLGGWDGFELIGVERRAEPAAGPPQVTLRLRATPGRAKHCSACGALVEAVHDVSERRVRDLPILDAETWLVLPRARVACPTCGPTVEAVPWLDRYQRMTLRFADSIARLAMQLPIKHVAAWHGVHWTTAKAIDERALVDRLGPVALDGLRFLAIDEFALHRGHRYATVVVDPLRKRVLWVGPGRGRDDLREFFTLLGPTRAAAIEAVAMDMSPAFAAEVQHHCPQAALVFDLFHVVAKYSREVLDRIRVDETNKLAKAAGPNRPAVRATRRIIKGARWLLLRNRATLTRHADRVRLRELLRVNRPLFIAYVLKDDLKQLWRFRYPAAARRFWRHWYRRAMASRVKPLQDFARLLATKIDGIISHCRYPLHTGLLEGINNKIKVLKRMAYGYRDQAYFFLKIRAAFPGIPS
jgi:transposase